MRLKIDSPILTRNHHTELLAYSLSHRVSTSAQLGHREAAQVAVENSLDSLRGKKLT